MPGQESISAEILAAVFAHGFDAVFLAGPDGTTIAANPAACALLGRTEEEICRLGRAGVVDPASPMLADVLAERERTGSSRGEVWLLHADGHRIPVDLASSAFVDSAGQPWNVITARDLRGRQAMQDELTASRLLLETIVGTTGDFIWSVSPDDFGIAWYNPALEQYFATKRGIRLAPGMRPVDLFDDPEPVRFWEDIYARALAEGTARTQYDTVAGTNVLDLTVTAMRARDSVAGISVFGRDVTAQETARRQLEERERRYRTILDTVTEGIVFQAADGTILEVNPAAELIEGRGEDEMLGRTSEDEQWGAVHADGTPFPGDEHPAMATLRTGEPEMGVVMGILTPRRERRWISINSAPVFDEGPGIPSAVVTTFRDITEQRQAEEELRIAAIAFEESQEAMVIAAADTTILRVNQAFVDVTGFERDEAVGQTTRLLSSGLHDPEFYQSMWDSLNTRHRWQGEIWNRRRNGEVYPEWLSITACTDDDGQVTNYVGTFIDLSASKKAEQDIFTLSFFDSLTGLPNRALLKDRLRQAVLGTVRGAGHGCLIFLDLDDFTALNDTRGHEAGDQLLALAARRLVTVVHADDTVARLGSDEFAVMVDGLDEDAERAARQAERIAQRLRVALAEPVEVAGQSVQCRASIGIAMFAKGEPEPAELFKRADAAVMHAKQSGRGAVHFFNHAIQDALEQRVQLESALRRAVPHDLRLEFQPQVDEGGSTFGAEALLRWHDRERGEIPPSVFIPLAEERGLIVEIGSWVLEEACRQLKSWEAAPETRHLILAVNVSARQFHQPDFVGTVLATLDRTGADATRLKLELTESVLVEDLELVAGKMSELRTHGVRFSLDDFGTGFSSLRSLKSLPIHQLKIDQSFVRDLPDDESSSAIVRMTIALGQSLGVNVIAEGVETHEQYAILRLLGCTSFQGYLFGRPGPADALPLRSAAASRGA